jgi:hypothetical protein
MSSHDKPIAGHMNFVAQKYLPTYRPPVRLIQRQEIATKKENGHPPGRVPCRSRAGAPPSLIEKWSPPDRRPSRQMFSSCPSNRRRPKNLLRKTKMVTPGGVRLADMNLQTTPDSPETTVLLIFSMSLSPINPIVQRTAVIGSVSASI